MQKQLYITLIVLTVCIVATALLFVHYGASALPLIGICFTTIAFYTLVHFFKQQENQSKNLLLALSHGDTSLGLTSDHPLHQQFLVVQQQLQASRIRAEQQSRFLKSLLTHIDLAVLAVNSEGDVVEQNPSVPKLLGTSINHLIDLRELGEWIAKATANKRTVVSWLRGDYEDTLSVALSVTDIQGQPLKLITLQSIREELQNREQQAYKTLTKVLTHEVANSITPLSSLAQTCSTILPEGLSFESQSSKQDVQKALAALASRTKHLGAFIQRFRDITTLPKPQLKPQKSEELIESVISLFRQQFEESFIELTVNIQTQTLLMGDKAQLEQVLINLVKNAEDSIKSAEKKHIAILSGLTDAGHLYIDIIDSGAGVLADSATYIFVPFYTTKQSGSGIGLSLAQQIMVNHGGELLLLESDRPASDLTGAHFRMLFSVVS